MTSIAPLPKMTVTEYLDWEPRQEQRYEETTAMNKFELVDIIELLVDLTTQNLSVGDRGAICEEQRSLTPPPTNQETSAPNPPGATD
jgi:hypothetical protein